jgi:hypothetical protein
LKQNVSSPTLQGQNNSTFTPRNSGFPPTQMRKWKRLPQLSIHADQKLVVVFGILHVFQEGVHCLLRVHIGQVVAQHPHPLIGYFINQQIVAAGTGAQDINGRENALVRQFAIQLQFHVTGSFEFFKDHFVHFRTCIRKGCCDDG